jgi:hypothetical protein
MVSKIPIFLHRINQCLSYLPCNSKVDRSKFPPNPENYRSKKIEIEMKSALRLDNRKHPAYANIPEPPLPTLHFQKLSHSLPLLLHLLISSIFIIFSVIISIVAHLFDGSGVKKSWNMATTILHSFMKSILMISSPSGRYSLDTIRFFTSFKIPDFLFRNCTFLADKVIIQATEGLAKLVRNCLDISPDQLRYLNDETGIRNIGVEWIKPKKSIQGQGSVVLFLHGGAHIFLSPNSHRSITTRLATMTNSVVCALDCHRRCNCSIRISNRRRAQWNICKFRDFRKC